MHRSSAWTLLTHSLGSVDRLIGRTAALLAGLMAAFAPLPALPAEAPANPPTTTTPVDFDRQIQPILARRCYQCHGPDKHEGGLKLNDGTAALQELDSGSRAIVPGNVAESALIARVTSADPGERMPPEGKPLVPEEIAALKQWIAEGAKWKEHWAFRPVAAPVVPEVGDRQWVHTPVDAFIYKRLDEHGLKPSPPAAPLELLRRVYFDLTGLPPTPAEADAFLADPSPAAYERLVDRLLASPRYGERWARHWLDVVRYADTNSFERDGPKPMAWRYRDYVIRAFNDDKPFDQFIREQLAGDELPAATADGLIATGFYRLGLWDDEPADNLQARFDELDDIVTTVSQAFLGLTVNCARCHDHKIDPIPQRDYYRLLAFFSGTTRYGELKGANIEKNSLRPLMSETERASQSQRVVKSRRKLAELDRRLAAIEDLVRPDLELVEKDEFRFELNRPRILLTRVPARLSQEQYDEYLRLASQRATVRNSDLLGKVLCISEVGPTAPDTFVLGRGNPHAAGDKVVPGFPEVLDNRPPQLPPPQPGARTSGRRLVLADWIASPENRLTPRVIVNRIWQHHFGRGIVRSPNNFGLMGDPPTHPELLDYLATRFVADGWRVKPLHRMILLSSAYRMSSRGETQGMSRDPDNGLFWRFNPRRLAAEEIRDAMLAATGELNLKMFGPGFFPEVSREVLAGQSVPGAGWGQSTRQDQQRRSIYIHVKRSLLTPMLASFDFPETDSTCEARFATTQPSQALGMLHGKFAQDRAAALGERVVREAGTDRAAQVRHALRLALSRPAGETEVARGLRLLETLERKHGLNSSSALKQYCLAVLNLNEFVYLD